MDTERGAAPPGGRRPRPPAPGALRLFRVRGIPVEVRPSWFLVTGLIAYLFTPVVRAQDPSLSDLGAYAFGLLFALLIYASIFLHETAHALVATRFGLPVRAITLQFLGGVSEIEREPETPWREFAIAVVGPLTSLAVGGAALGAAMALDDGTARLVVLQLGLANLIVGVFNLLPGLPLDGGRVLRAAVWRLTGRPGTATVVAAWSGRVVAVAVFALPWLLSATGVVRLGLISIVWFALLAFFLWSASRQALVLARLSERLPAIDARSLARRAYPAEAVDPVSEAVRAAREVQAGAIVVVDREGRPIGLVSETAVAATPEQRRPWIAVGDLSQRLEPGLVVSTGLAGEPLLAVLRERPATEYLVVEPDGRTWGVLARTDVDAAFARALRPAS